MYVEQIISKLFENSHLLEKRDRKFVQSIFYRAQNGDALTTRQGWAFLSILRKNNFNVELGLIKEDYVGLIKNPVWKIPLVPSKEVRNEVRYFGDNILGFRVNSSTSMQPDLIAIKAYYSDGLQLVNITNKAVLDATISFIGKWNFEYDEHVEKYLSECLDHVDTPTRVVRADDLLIIDVPNQNAFAQFTKHLLKAEIL